jgi:hypothetical protein
MKARLRPIKIIYLIIFGCKTQARRHHAVEKRRARLRFCAWL